MDMEFVKIKDLVNLLEVNTTAAREHVAEIAFNGFAWSNSAKVVG